MAAQRAGARHNPSKAGAVQTQQELFERLRGVLVELFEIEASRITLDSDLYEDLEIDSIDTIDLLLKLKELTGRKIQPEQFRHVRTVRDAVEALQALGCDTGVALRA